MRGNTPLFTLKKVGEPSMIINALNKDAHYFTLDVHGGAILTEPLKFKQHDDNSRVLAIELTVNDDV